MSAFPDVHPAMRLGLRWRALGAVVLAGALGWPAARALMSSAPALPPPPVLQAGAARLRVDVAWTPVARRPAAPGLPAVRTWAPYAGFPLTVSVAVLTPARAGAALAALRVRRPGQERIGGVPLHAYRHLGLGRSTVDLFTLDTTRGVLWIACAMPADGEPSYADCLADVGAVWVAGGRPLPGEDGAADAFIAGVVGRLENGLAAPLRALRRAPAAAGQAAAARAVARADGRAAAALETLAHAAPRAAQLAAGLRTTAAAYGRLAAAGRRRDRAGWRRAARTVARAEATLRRAL